MTNNQQSAAMFSQMDVSPQQEADDRPSGSDQTYLLQDILSAVDRQNELMEELIGVLGAKQRRKATELNQWRKAHPQLASHCRHAAETLGRVQMEFLSNMTEEIRDNGETLLDGEFMLGEFVDRYGPRLAHMHSMLQVLSQLAGPAETDEDI
ncbi:MAG: hypothetical protein MPJ50_11670 [Pirellulales bacterium]|nr:hypothetical protein [Pirellulales bacterium]